jgi:putative acetyltransferase
MQIKIDDLSGADIRALLEYHQNDMHAHSPADSCHVLDLKALQKPEITFWSARDGAGELMGCVAIKQLDATHAELKSMRTAPQHVRKGVAASLLGHVIGYAMANGYTRISLETGTPAAFAPARELYTKSGFVECAPFADYVLDPYSVFMTKAL